MKTNIAVRTIMEKQGVGVTKLAARMEKTPRLVSDRLAQENISISKLNEILRMLDYKVAILPRDARLPEDSFEIE